MPSLRGTILWIYGLFLVVVFPTVLYCHLHLFADGAQFLANLLQHGAPRGIGGTLTRAAHHLLTQLPVLGAHAAGLRDVKLLSWTYGAMLFLLPWACYASATLLFLRGGQQLSAALVTLAFCLNCCFSWVFIISESHLGAGLFFLAVAVLETRRPNRGAANWILLALILAGCLIYEFWVFYCVILLALLVYRARDAAGSSAARVAGTLSRLACVIGAPWLAYSIITSPLAGNRDAMVRSHLWSVLPETLLCNGIFLLAAIIGTFGWPPRPRSGESLGPRGHPSPPAAADRPGLLFGGLSCALLAVMLAFLFQLATPWHAYNHRLLNASLPILFGATLLAGRRFGAPGAGAERHAVPLMAPLLACLALAGFVVLAFHAVGFREFSFRLTQLCRGQSGYVPVDASARDLKRYGTAHTYPSLSVLLQPIHGAPITAVLCRPEESFQPHGPGDFASVRQLAGKLGLRLQEDSFTQREARPTPSSSK
jgi:hypothetical protein